MKSLILLLLSLVSFAGFAQTGFPTTITNTASVMRADDDMIQRAMREGEPVSAGARLVNSTWTGLSTSGGFGGPSLQPVTGKAYYITGITLGASRPSLMQLLFGRYAIGNYPVYSYPVPINFAHTFPVNLWVNDGRQLPSVSILSVFEADPLLTIAEAKAGSTNLTTSKPQALSPLTGNAYSYSITVTNSTASSLSAGAISVTDKLPSGNRFVAGGGNWTVSETGGTITAVSTTSLAAGATSPVSITLAPTVNSHFTMGVSGYLMDMDNDYTAPNIMPVIGTSISAGTGATSYKTMYTMRLRNWMRDTLGYQVRRINKAISGTQSVHHEDLRAFTNYYDFDRKTGVIICEMPGINDVAQSIPSTTSLANLSRLIRFKQQRYPLMTMLVLAPFPVTNAGNEALLAALSPQMAATVAGFNDPKVIFIGSTRTCFNPATDTTDGIHPNDAGNWKMFSAVKDEIVSRNIQFSLLLLAFPLRRRRKSRDRKPVANQPKTRTRLRDHFRR